jgi:dihydrofolate synthase/folylpolyglutamate synthase
MTTQLNQWLSKLQERNFSIKLGLDNVQTAAKLLNLTKPAPYVITVAGTNGKGSVTKLLESLLVQYGFKTGCYTSPHLVKFNERICINKKPILDHEIVTSFNSIEKKLENSKLDLTYFEFITTAAWQIFTNNNLDILILEIGLGGRLDAVNAIPKDLAIITSIDYDHQKFLGDTLDQIGFEKAGIITDGKPVILGDINMPNSVLAQAQQKSHEIYQLGQNYHINVTDTKLQFITENDNDIVFNLNKFANIKINNIATSIKALQIVHSHYKPCFNHDLITKVLQNFNIIGRCSWLDEKQNILLDVAHNKQSIANLANYLYQVKATTGKNITAICGMLADKDITSCFQSIYSVIDFWELVTIKDTRGELAENLAKIIQSIQPHAKYKLHDNINNCGKLVYNLWKKKQNDDSILVVFGSFHIVGPIYEYIQQERIMA